MSFIDLNAKKITGPVIRLHPNDNVVVARTDVGLGVDALASAMRVPVAKLQALEDDRLDELPDAVFARALALAVCRQLKTDAAPVLALLPSQDVSRLAPKNERGLDFPLDRPSFLPQSSFVVVARLFTPMRWAALSLLVLALVVCCIGTGVRASTSCWGTRNRPRPSPPITMALWFAQKFCLCRSQLQLRPAWTPAAG